MVQEELIKAVGKVIPNGGYSEEMIQLAFIMFTHGYNYAVDKVCDILNHYCNRSGVHQSWRVDIINHIRKAMEE